ncbi:uncharacterized protein LOC143179768 [Calliopsis andreniformis]|uniref:uncharacterized protein LOC143179768 n=1 Tax=Calliopsis andreniformis TaxID=337506 RepID=UPI003FCC74E8
MMRIKLIYIVSQIKNETALLTRNTVLQTCSTSKYNTSSKRYAANPYEGDEFDKPIQFSKTAAATAPAEHTRTRADTQPWYQGLVVSASLAAFFIYFGVLREENDIDEKLSQEVHPQVQEYLYGVKAAESRKQIKGPMS